MAWYLAVFKEGGEVVEAHVEDAGAPSCGVVGEGSVDQLIVLLQSIMDLLHGSLLFHGALHTLTQVATPWHPIRPKQHPVLYEAWADCVSIADPSIS